MRLAKLHSSSIRGPRCLFVFVSNEKGRSRVPSLQVAILAALFVSGCTSFEPYLRPGLTIQYDLPPRSCSSRQNCSAAKFGAHEEVVDESLGESFSDELKQAVALKCETTYDDSTGRTCLYEYVAIKNMKFLLSLDDGTAADVRNRTNFVQLLISLSRQNCNRFLARMSANRQGLDFWQRFLGNLSSTASGASAFATPFASVGISGASQIMNEGMGAADATYYQASQIAFETAIRSNMQADENVIESRLNGSTPYPIMTAIADVSELDSDCSLDRGLAFVTAATQSQAQGGGAAPGTLAPSSTPSSQLQFAVQWTKDQQNKLVLAPDMFALKSGAKPIYSIAILDGPSLPSWLSFDADTKVFQGKPDIAGSWLIKVTAKDNATGQSVSQIFKIEVQ